MHIFSPYFFSPHSTPQKKKKKKYRDKVVNRERIKEYQQKNISLHLFCISKLSLVLIFSVKRSLRSLSRKIYLPSSPLHAGKQQHALEDISTEPIFYMIMKRRKRRMVKIIVIIIIVSTHTVLRMCQALC